MVAVKMGVPFLPILVVEQLENRVMSSEHSSRILSILVDIE